MSDTNRKSSEPPIATPAPYSKELPTTPQKRAPASSDFDATVADKEQGPDPRDTASPYGSTYFNGTNDSSRFSTPPPKKS